MVSCFDFHAFYSFVRYLTPYNLATFNHLINKELINLGRLSKITREQDMPRYLQEATLHLSILYLDQQISKAQNAHNNLPHPPP